MIESIKRKSVEGPLDRIPVKAPKIPQKMVSFIILLFVFLILIILTYNLFTEYIRPNQFGIKVVHMGIKRGVQEKIYHAGLNFVIPGFQKMHHLPKEIQVLELTNYPSTAARNTRKEKAAHIQTSDGFFVDVDVSILYHIENPYLVFTTIGPGNLFQDNGIIPKAEPILKETLGKLTTENFYNSHLRVEKALEAKKKFNEELKGKGLSVNHVLVRYFRYSNEIQKNIEEKKLKDQLVFTNQSAARAAMEEAILKKIIQEGKVLADIELEKGKAYVTRKNAERDLYVRKKKAEADLLIKLAEAEKTRLRNKALEGAGAERMVGLKMAEVYKGLDLIILSSDGENGVNPLDLNNTLKLFDVRK